jgi:hypothetical protein
MNIFASNPDPRISAVWLDDLRANKMILESCQMLSTAVHQVDPNHTLKLYKSFNPNHPCCLWVKESKQNFYWLLLHTKALLARSKVNHKSNLTYETCFDWFKLCHYKLEDNPQLIFKNCAANDGAGINYKNVKDVHLAYRLYLNHRWKEDKKPPTWTTGVKPDWCDLN